MKKIYKVLLVIVAIIITLVLIIVAFISYQIYLFKLPITIYEEGKDVGCSYKEYDNKIYYSLQQEFAYAYELKDVDVKTFRIVKADGSFARWSCYGLDKNHVYIDNNIIEGADPATFEVISMEKAKDKNHTYYNDDNNVSIIK